MRIGEPNVRRAMRTIARASRAPAMISLLRSSLGALGAGRPQCHHCHRNPLVGERVYVYAATGGERVVCELCRPLRREPPLRSELVHSPEHHRAVKSVPRAA
jgi:hypothetical protein